MSSTISKQTYNELFQHFYRLTRQIDKNQQMLDTSLDLPRHSFEDLINFSRRVSTSLSAPKNYDPTKNLTPHPFKLFYPDEETIRRSVLFNVPESIQTFIDQSVSK
ncbi:hypothetical protein GEMRC1_006600 [Eukaryota sp. GEM-RC1]